MVDRSIAAIAAIVVTLAAAGPSSGAGQRSVAIAHEHVGSAQDVPKLLEAMDATGVQVTALLGGLEVVAKGIRGVSVDASPGVNNRVIFEATRQHPGRFVAFPMLSLADPDAQRKLQGLMARGARGVTLYAYPGNTPAEDVLLEHMVGRNLLVFVHAVGPPTDTFRECLRRHARLRFIMPGLTCMGKEFPALATLLAEHPNLWSDLSLGPTRTLRHGLLMVSRRADELASLVRRFPDRFLMGTDMWVLGGGAARPSRWVSARIMLHRSILEERTLSPRGLEAFRRARGAEAVGELSGLGLEGPVLGRVLWDNFAGLAGLR